MMLPFNGLSIPPEPKPSRPPRPHVIISDDSYQADSSTSSTEDADDSRERRVPRYVIPPRRKQKPKSPVEDSSRSILEEARASIIETSQEGNQTASIADQDPGYFLHSSSSVSSRSSGLDQRPRRGSRQRQPPQWMRTDDWQIQHKPYIMYVDSSQIVKL